MTTTDDAGPRLAPERLAAWITAELITSEQATRIARWEAEHTQPAAPQAQPRRTVEALGYVGGAIVTAALIILTVGYWDQIHRAWQLAIPAVAAAGLLAAGIAARPQTEPSTDNVMERLRSVLWLASCAATAAFAGVLLDTVGVIERPAVLIVAGVLLAQALPLWLLHPRAPQQLAVFVGTVVLAAVGASYLQDAWSASVGSAIAVTSLAWAAAAHWRRLPVGQPAAPRPATAERHSAPPAQASWGIRLGIGGAAVGAVVIAASGQTSWLGIVAVAAALTFSLAVADLVALGISAVGTMIVLPIVVDHYLDSTLLTAASLLVTGLAMVALAVLVAHRKRKSNSLRP